MGRPMKIYSDLELSPQSVIKNFALEVVALDPDPAKLKPGQIWYNISSKKFHIAIPDPNDQSKVVISYFTDFNDLQTLLEHGGEVIKVPEITVDKRKYPSGTIKEIISQIYQGLDDLEDGLSDVYDLTSEYYHKNQDKVDNLARAVGAQHDGTTIKPTIAFSYATNEQFVDVNGNKPTNIVAAIDNAAGQFESLKLNVLPTFVSKTTTDAQTIQSDLVISKNLTVQGNLDVVGEVRSPGVKTIEDSYIELNSQLTTNDEPVATADIRVNRGKNGVTSIMVWDEGTQSLKLISGFDDNGKPIYTSVSELSGNNTDSTDSSTQISDLKKSLNNTRYKFEASDADTSFSIAHNLNTEFVMVQVWVYDDDEKKWYNDSVTVSIVDANNISVELSEAKKIRAVIYNMEYQFV
jgi:hypothetical protein